MDTQNTNFLTPSKMLSQALNIFTTHFSSIAGVVTPMVVVYVISQVLSFYARGGKGSPAVVISSGVFSLIWAVVSIVGFIALVKTVSAIINGVSIQPESAYREGVKLIGPVAVTGLLSALFTGLGFFAFIVPGVILSVYLTFATLTTVIDGKRGFEAILASVHLVRGKWAQVFKYVFVLGLFAIIATLLVAMVSNVFFSNFALLSDVINTAFSSFVVAPVALLFELLLLRELRQVTQPMTELDRASYKRNITASTLVGIICLVAAAFLLYQFAAHYFVTNPTFFNR